MTYMITYRIDRRATIAIRLCPAAQFSLRRPGAAATEVRLLFVCDPDRQAVILVGGDKAGNGSGWYRDAVPQAEQAYAEHLKDPQAVS
ncbi:type II toxin-antitoxin system RelE/ParE family toxin [Streptomyces clavifer]|uniref:type II toxin-antitoxin system RelE/ParE family toxin n=1 Tax=Streptomyces clavifer TaxID=68188 RepID=UPI0033BEDE6C